MVYGGLVNKKIIAQLQALNCTAIGLTGADLNIIPATKRPIVKVPKPSNVAVDEEFIMVDYGFVGDINNELIQTKNIDVLLSNNFTLVVAPLTHDGMGQILNTNADTIASVLAISLSKHFDTRLIFCFEKQGVLQDVKKEDSVITRLNQSTYEKLLKAGSFHDGIFQFG